MWIILITDGAPDSGQDIHGLAREIHDGVNSKAFVFLAVGVAASGSRCVRYSFDDTDFA
jgi:uncharacterized protein YegL